MIERALDDSVKEGNPNNILTKKAIEYSYYDIKFLNRYLALIN